MFSDVELGVFMDELEEKLQILNDGLLVLERDETNQEVIQEIFRAAHTIKGSSGIMGYDKMAGLTHEMENLFDLIRHGEVHVTSEMVNVLFEALDTLKLLKDEITGEASGISIEAVVTKIKQYLNKGEEEDKSSVTTNPTPTPFIPDLGNAEAGVAWLALDDVVENVVREAELRGYSGFQINIMLDKDCQMKAVRAFLIFESLQQVGEIIKSDPPAEDIQEGRFNLGFQIVFLTKEDVDRIHNLLITISEVNRVDINPIGSQKQAVPENPVKQAEPGKVESAKQTPARETVGTERKAVKTVRVDVQKLDTLMNLVGELVIDRTRLNRFVEIFDSRDEADDLVDSLNEISNHLGQVTGDLQEQIMKARMLPVAQTFNRFPRMVRDTAQKLAKEIDFIVEGKETELDRNVIEVIGDPLIHLIRNAIDHGIESPAERQKLGKPTVGTLRLKASYHESHIVIMVEDDGKGIDVEKIRRKAVELGWYDAESAARTADREILDLIFKAGFSTASTVSDLSGRGVGMDVVRTAIEQINGTVELDTKVGVGTKFTIRLPLTLAIIRALMVSLDQQVYAVPLTNVLETIRITPAEIKRIANSEVIVVREKILPLVRLADLFRTGSEAGSKMFVVIVGSGEKKVALVVDKLIGEQEIVIKSLGDYLGQISGLSGATILGDGRVALIVDVRGIVKELGAAEEPAYAAS